MGGGKGALEEMKERAMMDKFKVLQLQLEQKP